MIGTTHSPIIILPSRFLKPVLEKLPFLIGQVRIDRRDVIAPGQPMPPKARLLGSRQSQGTIQRLSSGHDRATSSSPVVAQAEIAPSIARAKSGSKRSRLESEWAVENSRGERLFRSQAHIPMEKSRPSSSNIFPESRLAHELLDGLEGLEIGPASHNPFGLKTRNVGLTADRDPDD
jgi:hypothetical protein